MSDDWLKTYLEGQFADTKAAFADMKAALERHANDDHQSFQAVHARIDATGIEVKELRDTSTKAHVWALVATAVGGFLASVGLVWLGNWLRTRGGQ